MDSIPSIHWGISHFRKDKCSDKKFVGTCAFESGGHETSGGDEEEYLGG